MNDITVLDLYKQNGHKLITGKTQDGKTTFAKKLYMKHMNLTLFIDYQNYFKINNSNIKLVLERLFKYNKSTIYTVENNDDLNLLLNTIYEMYRKDYQKLPKLTIIMDECNKYKDITEFYFTKCLRYGISCIAICQRFQQLNGTSISEDCIIEHFFFIKKVTQKRLETNYDIIITDEDRKIYEKPYHSIIVIEDTKFFLNDKYEIIKQSTMD
jgi:hypothetical protein